MKKTLVIILSLTSISNANTLKKSINEIDIVKNKIYIIKQEDEIKPLTKYTIINIVPYKDKRVVTLLSGLAKLIIKD